MKSPFCNLAFRSSPVSRRPPVCQTCIAAQLHLHTSRYSTQTAAANSLSASMLARASKKYEASQPLPQQRSRNKSELEQQLFPSSSPSSANANIRDQLKRCAPSRFASSPGLAGRKNASQSQMAKDKSVTERPTASSGGTGRGSLVSLYKNKASFFHTPVIDLEAESTNNATTSAVFYGEDDFSDDDNLDLDFKAPSALPLSNTTTLISKPAEAAKENIPPKNLMMPPPPPSSNSELPIPWSSSPASHFFPPQQIRTESQSSSEGDVSLKRDGSWRETDDDCIETSAPKRPTKRTIPQGWRDDKPTEEPVSSNHEEVPVVKAEARHLWDPSASAVKEKKKQLKNKKNKAKRDENEVKMEEIEAVPKETTTSETTTSETTSKTPLPKPIVLSHEQLNVLDLVVEKKQSIFFTGPAGTGKSVLMRAIIDQLMLKYRDKELVSVTASTGLAACNIGGMTLHSFSGIGLGKESAAHLIKKVRRNQKAKNRWLKTKVLIIDEISMVDGDLFDKLSQIGRTIRNNGRPWGGIQLVITGDFFQLPPVPEGNGQAKFAFDAATWNTSIDHTIGLTQVFRQRDPDFARMLNEMRLGKITSETVNAFKALERPLKFEDGVDSAELFPLRSQVEGSNTKRLQDLPGQTHRYQAADFGEPAVKDKLLANMMAPKTIDLKLNAQVMLIKNLDAGLVNGSLGIVIGFSDEKTYHMSGGETSHGPDEDEGKTKRGSSFSKRQYPIVQFTTGMGIPRVVLCQPEEWKVELPSGEVQAKRIQLPLILAWALSIHKAQGQTLERVTVNLGKVFEKGQAYVALSRATSQAGLRVIGFDKNKVMAHPKVVEFYNKLYSAADAMSSGPSSILDFVAARRGIR